MSDRVFVVYAECGVGLGGVTKKKGGGSVERGLSEE